MYSSEADIKIEKSFLLKEDEKTYGARCSGRLLHNPKRYRLIDLFCGAGGMSLGFSEAFGQPFQSIWANDFNQYCVDTYNANFGKHCIAGDIVQILEEEKLKSQRLMWSSAVLHAKDSVF